MLSMLMSAQSFSVLRVPTSALSFSTSSAARGAVARLALPAVDEDCGCTQPGSIMMNDVLVTATTLRSMQLADASGARATISSVIGEDGRAVVIFLRHLG